MAFLLRTRSTQGAPTCWLGYRPPMKDFNKYRIKNRTASVQCNVLAVAPRCVRPVPPHTLVLTRSCDRSLPTVASYGFEGSFQCTHQHSTTSWGEIIPVHILFALPWRILYFGAGRYVFWYKFTDLSDERAASIFRVWVYFFPTLSHFHYPSAMNMEASLFLWIPIISTTSQKTVLFIVPAVLTTDVT